MTVRRQQTNAYDSMMAEIQAEDRSRAQTQSAVRSENKAAEAKDKQNDEFKSGREDKQPPRHSSFPSSATRAPASGAATKRRSSRSHGDNRSSGNDSDHEVQAPVRHVDRDQFVAKPGLKVMAAADTDGRAALRSFLMRAPKLGSPAIRCYVERDRQGLNRLHPIYRLYLEDGKQFLLCAQKRSTSKTSNYLLTMEKTPTDRRSPLILGKLRANWSGSEYIMYDAGLSPSKTALDVNVRSLLGLTEFEYDDMGPGRINVRIPPVNETGLATQWKDPGLEKNGAAGRSSWEHSVGGEAVMLRNKRPQYDEKRGGHVLDFHGRVSMPSVKNFQLQSDTHADDPTLQFGRVTCQLTNPRAQCKCHKNTFNMDVRHPLSPLQAFAICLSTIDSKFADLKVYENMTKLLKKK